jgi:hypothetical protein
VPRVGRILLQLSAQPGDMGVDRTAAHGGARTPYLAEQLHSRCDRSPPPHQGKEEPEFGSGHPHWLSAAEHRLSGGLQEDAAEANRSRQSGRGAGGKTASSAQQLLHSRDQLAYDRSVRVSGAIRLITTNEVCLCTCDRSRSGDLKLMYRWACLFDCTERFSRNELRRGRGCFRFVSRCVLIVDDEDSRNASIVGAVRRAPRELW